MTTQIGVVEVTCVSCNTKHTILVPTMGYRLWATGQVAIQYALPSLTDSEREMLLSNICPKCWDKLQEGM